MLPSQEMATSSFPNKRQKSNKSAVPRPQHQQNSSRSDKARKNQDPSPATWSDPASGEQRRNEHHPWGSIPMQQRIFHNFDAPTKNSPLQARRNMDIDQPSKLEIPSQPPRRPKLSSIFPSKNKATEAEKSSPVATAQKDKVADVGSPTSVSSSSSNERSAERKSRRHQLKKLPSVQHRPPRVKERGGGAGTRSGHRRGSDSSSTEAMDEMSYHSYASSTIPYPAPMGIYPPPVPLYPSPPAFMYPANYLLQPQQPEQHTWTDHDADEHSSLKEIKEDDGEDDIKGFDDFVMY